MRKFDLGVSLRNEFEKLRKGCGKEDGLSLLVVDAVDEEPTKLNDVQSILLQLVDVLNTLQQTAVDQGDQGAN